LRIKEERRRVVDEVSKTFGQIDILINNAEFTAPYHALVEDDINSVIEISRSTDAINPVPHMLNVDRHIVCMSSRWKSRPNLPRILCCNQVGADRIYGTT
jgi:NAD(P)-dependent dehydrogenase (short-subunit alcohol dehydrogenase family)